MIDVNPRLKGFNYGIGWGPTPKPPIYDEARALALVLGELATKASSTAWALQMAIRCVRLAETDTEKARAVADLEKEMGKHRRVLKQPSK